MGAYDTRNDAMSDSEYNFPLMDKSNLNHLNQHQRQLSERSTSTQPPFIQTMSAPQGYYPNQEQYSHSTHAMQHYPPYQPYEQQKQQDPAFTHNNLRNTTPHFITDYSQENDIASNNPYSFKETQPIIQQPQQPPIGPIFTPKKRKRFCCGCFSTRRTCCSFWLVFMTLLLLIAGLLIFFLFPRIPTISLSDPYINPQISPFNLQTKPGASSFTINISINATVNSANYINYDVSTISSVGNLRGANNENLQNVAVAGVVRNVVIGKMALTNIVIPLVITYTLPATLPTLLADPVIVTLLQACGFDGGPKSNLQVAYTVKVGIDAVTWTGYTPSFNGVGKFACPVTKAQWATVIGSLSPGFANQ